MYLERIDIQGFKSFADPTTLLFNKELTAVVGPNGSGKSNVADAIRWVLGEQSLKLLRGKKSEDVIFAGSESKGRMGFAKVAMHLNNKNHQAGIDYEEVVIERTLNRSGESEYSMNGSPVRLSDVQLLLARAQVGQKSYSVIGQGTIDSLLSFSAQERRDFFDEATGVRQYQMKKNQALHKLELTEENLQQAELVLQEIEPRLRTLSRQVRRLERKEVLEQELTKLQSNYYGFLYHELDTQLTNLRKKKDHEESALNELTRQQQTIQKQLDMYEHEPGREDRYKNLQAKLFNLQQEYNALTKKKIMLEGQKDLDLVKSGNHDAVALKQRLHDVVALQRSLKTKYDDLGQEIQRHETAIAALTNTIETTKASLTKLQKDLSQETTTTHQREFEDEAKKILEHHSSLVKDIDEVKALDHLERFKERFKTFSQKLSTFLQLLQRKQSRDHAELWKEFTALSHEHDKLTAELATEHTDITLKKHERDAAGHRLKETESEHTKLEAELSGNSVIREQSLSAEVKDIDTQLHSKEQAIQTLRSEIDQFNQSEQTKTQELVTLQKKFRTMQYDVTVKNNELTTLKVDLAKLETRKEDLDKEKAQEAPTIELGSVEKLNEAETKEQIETLKKQLNIIGGIDTETVTEYKDVHEKHTFLTQQTTDLRSAQKSLTTLIDDLDQQIKKQFEGAFKNISTHFSKYFKQLFNGGSAKLTLIIQQPEAEPITPTESEETEDTSEEKPTKKTIDTFSYTVEIQATPPGKKLSSINMLSGGEKALTSIALICSIIANNPPPFVVLDEVDAALDEANSIRFAEIISELMDQSQFITITHNRATMHQAKILYGITMGSDGVSRLLSVNFDQADKLSS